MAGGAFFARRRESRPEELMKPKETDIRLNRDDLKCLNRGGSIEYKIMDGENIAAVVNLSIEREKSAVAENCRVEP